jgi:hypothetical protein
LGINDYFKLQRFLNRVFSTSHAEQNKRYLGNDEEAAEGYGTKKKSRDNMRDRRASMSIGDMLTMQGHNTSKLFKQGSSLTLSSKIPRTNSTTVDIDTDVQEGKSSKSPSSPRSGIVSSSGSKSPRKSAERRSSLSSVVGGDVNKQNPSKISRQRSRSLAIGSVSMGGFGSEFGGFADDTGIVSSNSGKFGGIDNFAQDSPFGLKSTKLSIASEESILPSAPVMLAGIEVSAKTNTSFFGLDAEDSTHAFETDSQKASEFVDDEQSIDEMLGLQRVSSAMLMRSTSEKVSFNHAPGATPYETPKNLPNKFLPLPLTVKSF